MDEDDAGDDAGTQLLGGEIGPPPVDSSGPLPGELPPVCFGRECTRIRIGPMERHTVQEIRIKMYNGKVLHGTARRAID